jgi:hypothetical protein
VGFYTVEQQPPSITPIGHESRNGLWKRKKKIRQGWMALYTNCQELDKGRGKKEQNRKTQSKRKKNSDQIGKEQQL